MLDQQMSQETIDTQFVSQLSELSLSAIVNYSILMVVRMQTTDRTKFMLAVETLESLTADQLQEEEDLFKAKRAVKDSKFTELGFFEMIAEERKSLDEKMSAQQKLDGELDYRIAQLKFRRIMRFLNRQMPRDVVGEL